MCIPAPCSSQALPVKPPTAGKTGGLQNPASPFLAALLPSNSQPLCKTQPHQTFSSNQLLLILRNPSCYSQREEEATLFSLKLTCFSLNQDWQTQNHRSPARKEQTNKNKHTTQRDGAPEKPKPSRQEAVPSRLFLPGPAQQTLQLFTTKINTHSKGQHSVLKCWQLTQF